MCEVDLGCMDSHEEATYKAVAFCESLIMVSKSVTMDRAMLLDPFNLLEQTKIRLILLVSLDVRGINTIDLLLIF